MTTTHKIRGMSLILILLLSGITTYKYLQPHPAIGEWEKQFVILDKLAHVVKGNKTPFQPVKLWVFKDNTAIYQSYGIKVHCKWTEKAGNFIVLLCDGFVSGSSTVFNFKIDPDQTGYLDANEVITMIRTPSLTQQQEVEG